MNPLLLKVGIPLAIIGVLAFMRWTNSKATGEPFFPGVGDNSKGKPGGGGAGSPTIGVMHSDQSVQDSGTYDDTAYSDFVDTTQDTTDNTTDSGPISTQVTGAGAGSGAGGSSIPALRGGIGMGGVAQPSQPVATAISNTLQNPYTGGYVPYAPVPPTVIPTPHAGGGGVYVM